VVSLLLSGQEKLGVYGGEGGIETSVVEGEVSGWWALVCLLFSTGPDDLKLSSVFTRA
jgi:hypothetical protein